MPTDPSTHVPRYSWNLVYETDDGASWLRPVDELSPGARVELSVPVPTASPSGWTGRDGPAIAPESWPRSPGSGMPMRHGLTLWLPSEYLVHGPALPGIAIFQGDVDDDVVRRDDDDPFEVQRRAARSHDRLTTEVSSYAPKRFALVWLTRDELEPGPTPPPEDLRRAGERRVGPNAWDDPEPTRRVWLTQRDDPNVGIPSRDPRRRPVYDEYSGAPVEWAARVDVRLPNHLGGTYVEIDWIPDLSPRFLQLDRSSTLDLQASYAGILAVDLEQGTFDFIA